MKVSTCRKEITPEGEYFPCSLMGHAIRTEKAVGIMDRLWTTALLLEIEQVKLLWITVELIGLEREFTDQIKARITERFDVPEENINICFTHTHSAPAYQEESPYGAIAVPGYMDFVAGQVVAAAEECFSGGMIEAEAYAGTILLESCYCNRNGKDKPCDKSVTTLEFRAGERVVAGIGHFTCHSTVLGPQNLLVSSDLAGYVARALENRWGVYPIMMIGAAGDMSNRLFRRGNDLAELNRVGKEMMDQVFANSRQERLEVCKPRIYTYRFTEVYYPEKAKKELQYQEIKRKVDNAATYDEKKVFTSALAKAKAGLACKPFELDMVCRYLDLGDLKLFTIPGELFSRFGLELKKAMGGKCPICWGYSNYTVGYLGNREDYGASFETASSDIPIGTTERMVEEMTAFIRRCNEEKENQV